MIVGGDKGKTRGEEERRKGEAEGHAHKKVGERKVERKRRGEKQRNG